MTGTTTSAGVAGALSDETGSAGGGLLVFNQSPTLVTPTVASFANATHTHTTAAGGGQLSDAALSAPVSIGKGGTGTASTLTGLVRGSATAMTGAELSGDVTTSGSNATTIAAGAVTYSKMQNISAVSRLLGRGQGVGPGVTQEISLGPGLTMAGTVLDSAAGSGDITGVGDCTSGQCDVIGNLRHRPMVTAYTPAAGAFTITLGNTQLADLGTVSAAFVVNNPTGTAYDREFLRLHVCSTAPWGITWGSEFRMRYGPPLPTMTTGTASCDLFGFQRDQAALKWDMVSTSQGSLSAARRTCMIVTGSDETAAAVLADANIGPQRNQCFIPSAALVEEITVDSDAGTPSVIVHGRLGTSDTPLLSSALATAAAGAVACARPTAVVGFTTGVTCSATLINPTLSAGTWLGTTSGTAGGVAKRLSIAISYVLVN
jgi:hypothetical protein